MSKSGWFFFLRKKEHNRRWTSENHALSCILETSYQMCKHCNTSCHMISTPPLRHQPSLFLADVGLGSWQSRTLCVQSCCDAAQPLDRQWPGSRGFGNFCSMIAVPASCCAQCVSSFGQVWCSATGFGLACPFLFTMLVCWTHRVWSLLGEHQARS